MEIFSVAVGVLMNFSSLKYRFTFRVLNTANK